MKIRTMNMEDLDQVMRIYEKAREYMIEEGNANQWDKGYPSKELLQEDIEKKQAYVVDNKGTIEAVFILMGTEEPSYATIEGAWISDKAYGTIHRMASAGNLPGMGKYCLDWCKERYEHLRIDTHEKNISMRRLIENNDFTYCGIIYVRAHSPRRAYAYEKKEGKK